MRCCKFLRPNLFQKVGVFKKFNTKVKSLGKVSITGNISDTNYFKVPTLRNISKTAPYFHSGDVITLKDAVKVMIDVQLGIKVKDSHIDKIVLFLKTLDGEYPTFLKDTK